MKLKISASLILCRESQNNNFEVLMIRRKQNLHFGNAFVFPGGLQDPPDTDPYWLTRTSSHQEHIRSTPFSPEIDLTALRITAIRETWEETGVLLADKKLPDTSDFIKTCQSSDVTPSIEKLYYFCRIITPTSEKKRYDTTFFISIEDSQDVKIDIRESDIYQWASPAQFIQEGLAGRIFLLPPQVYILKILSSIENLNRLFWYVESIEKFPLLFQIERLVDGQMISVLPGDYRHDFTPKYLKNFKSENFISIFQDDIKIIRSDAALEYLRNLIQ